MRYGRRNFLGLTNKKLFNRHFQENTLLMVRFLTFPYDFGIALKNISDEPNFAGLDELLSLI
jgi:hypothetical protein